MGKKRCQNLVTSTKWVHIYAIWCKLKLKYSPYFSSGKISKLPFKARLNRIFPSDGLYRSHGKWIVLETYFQRNILYRYNSWPRRNFKAESVWYEVVGKVNKSSVANKIHKHTNHSSCPSLCCCASMCNGITGNINKNIFHKTILVKLEDWLYISPLIEAIDLSIAL